MYATDQDQTPKRADRKRCPGCDASVAGCEGVRWLRGQWCCKACAGNHDTNEGRSWVCPEHEERR